MKLRVTNEHCFSGGFAYQEGGLLLPERTNGKREKQSKGGSSKKTGAFGFSFLFPGLQQLPQSSELFCNFFGSLYLVGNQFIPVSKFPGNVREIVVAFYFLTSISKKRVVSCPTFTKSL